MIDQKLNHVDELCVNTIRTLSIDAVQQANSGHPGAPMGAALMTYVLWDRHLKHNPANPRWPDRDRFVLSAGHASMLLYSLLYLTGYPGITLDDIKNFRQWDSPCFGHPEYWAVPGIETTTGPLGQGFATAVGMAVAERFLGAKFNRAGNGDIVDHHTYVLASDGDMQEGVSHEAAAFAGHQQLGKLICIYDSNDIQLDGPTSLAFSEDVGKRFEAYGWHVQHINGMDADEVEAALVAAKAETAKPSLIVAKTHIGFGSPNKHDSSKAHGSPLGAEEVALTKQAYGWPQDKFFYVPDDALAHFREAIPRGEAAQSAWESKMASYAITHPADAKQFVDAIAGDLPGGWERALPSFTTDDKPAATRASSGATINAIASAIPLLVGGSADLSESNSTEIKDGGIMGAGEPGGRNIYYGVREHGMVACVNGMAAHGGVVPFAGTFFTFSDYCRGAIRIAALSHFRSILVFTHDSVGLGEDGPTHQPIEHLAAMRAMPIIHVIRPADANEAAMAWKAALEYSGPTALVLSRQAVPHLAGTQGGAAEGLLRGAYVVSEAEGGRPDAILIATGSEVAVAVGAQGQLRERGVRARVVSMPCWELFEDQEQAYRDEILPPQVRARVSVEAGVTLGWERWVTDEGACIGIDGRFGWSAPGAEVLRRLGFTPENVAEQTMKVVERVSAVRA
jgi:transketolase